MALLLKEQIIRYAKDEKLKLLGEDYLEGNIEPCSYDLRVGSIFRGNKIYSLENKKIRNSIVEVKPSEIVTVLTLEEVKIPANIAGTVFAMNSLSSIGFLILNPGHIDPGYHGPISICAINLSKEIIRLRLGETKIFTILFEGLEKDTVGYSRNQSLIKTRKERDEIFSIEKATKLSTSFFDLLKLNNYRRHFEKLFMGILIRRLFQVIVSLGVLISLYVGIIKIIEHTNGSIDEFKTKANMYKDSVNRLNQRIDSLNNVKTK